MTKIDNANNNAVIRISPDNMTVMLVLPDDKEYGSSDILDMLKAQGVVQGVNKEAIADAVDNRKFNVPIEIARGKAPVDGVDGRFDWLFTSNKSGLIRNMTEELDYKEAKLFEVVMEGQPLAKYVPATSGTFGFNVCGKLVNPKKGKELPPLIGRGIVVSEDRKVYTAGAGGRVLESDGRIDIRKVKVIEGDVSDETGAVKFDGDVIVKGNVLPGGSLEATGDIQIDGFVERANIVCERSLLVKEGILGGKVSRIKVSECVYSRFLENASIYAGMDIITDYIIDCNIECGGKLRTIGKKGGIIGGQIYAFEGVETNDIGNQAHVPTAIAIGLNKKIFDEYSEIAKELEKKESELKTFKKTKNDMIGKYSQLQLRDSEMFGKIRMAIDVVSKNIEELQKKKNDYLALAADLVSREIVVKNTSYPNVKIVIDMKELNLEQEIAKVVFKANQERIMAYKI